MRAVPEVVVGEVESVDEIDEPIDALAAVAGQIVVPSRHARVDDRDAHTRAVVSELLSDCRGAHAGGRTLERSGDATVEPHLLNKRIAGQAREEGVRDIRGVTVEKAQPPPDPSAATFDRWKKPLKRGGIARAHDDP